MAGRSGDREVAVRMLDRARKQLQDARDALVAWQMASAGTGQYQLLDPKTGQTVDTRLDGEARVEFFEQQVKDLEAALAAIDDPSRAPEATDPPSDPHDDTEVSDEGTGLDIPTISVPGAATAGAPASGGGMPRAGIFLPVGIALLILASLASLRVMTAGTEAASTAAPTTTSRPSTPNPTTTSVPVITTATPQPSRTTPVFVVTGHPAVYFGGPKCSQMTVAFSWTIDGLGNNGNYVLQFANYGQGYGSENGPFTITASSNATQTWDPPTHLLTLRMPVGEIPTEWGARITKVLNTPIQGDGESKAPLSPCTQG